jgi:hypothetical protein
MPQYHSFETLEAQPIFDQSERFTVFQGRVGAYVVIARHEDRATLALFGDDANSVITLIEQGVALDAVIDPYVGTVAWDERDQGDEALPPAPPELLVIA